MLIGVIGAIVTLLVVAGMILMAPGNTETSEGTAQSRTPGRSAPSQPEGVEQEAPALSA
jgi:hypothetical protein